MDSSRTVVFGGMDAHASLSPVRLGARLTRSMLSSPFNPLAAMYELTYGNPILELAFHKSEVASNDVSNHQSLYRRAG